MTLSGLLMLVFSVSLVTTLLIWCYYKVLKNNGSPKGGSNIEGWAKVELLPMLPMLSPATLSATLQKSLS